MSADKNLVSIKIRLLRQLELWLIQLREKNSPAEGISYQHVCAELATASLTLTDLFHERSTDPDIWSANQEILTKINSKVPFNHMEGLFEYISGSAQGDETVNAEILSGVITLVSNEIRFMETQQDSLYSYGTSFSDQGELDISTFNLSKSTTIMFAKASVLVVFGSGLIAMATEMMLHAGYVAALLSFSTPPLAVGALALVGVLMIAYGLYLGVNWLNSRANSQRDVIDQSLDHSSHGMKQAETAADEEEYEKDGLCFGGMLCGL